MAGTSPSVLRSYMDRDILMGEGGYRHPNISVFHAMMADGQMWVSGSQQMTDEGHADFREDQGPQFSQFFGASEDIYRHPLLRAGLHLPQPRGAPPGGLRLRRARAREGPLYKVSRAEWCFESFAANDRYLSVLLAGGDAGQRSPVRSRRS